MIENEVLTEAAITNAALPPRYPISTIIDTAVLHAGIALYLGGFSAALVGTRR